MVKAKYNHGHHLLDIPHVVLGMYDPRKKQGYIQLVEKRDADTFPIIHQNVPIGTEIWSDEWHAYSRLNELGYVYKTVNHSRNFKDPVTE